MHLIDELEKELGKQELPDVHVGVGRYAGIPDSYRHLHDVGPVDDATVAAIPGVADGFGGRETLYEAMQCSIGTGRCPRRPSPRTTTTSWTTRRPCPPTTYGQWLYH